jgi:hypothetical protein
VTILTQRGRYRLFIKLGDCPVKIRKPFLIIRVMFFGYEEY